MNANQKLVYRMFNTVFQTCEDFKTDWTGTASFVTPYVQFVTNVINKFASALAQQAQKSTGVTANKRTVRALLETQTLFLAESMTAYAASVGDDALLKDAHLTESQVIKLSDDAIIGKATVMVTLATANLANLGPYKITTAVINTLKATITKYSGLIGKPQQAIDKSKEGTDWIEELIKEGRRLLDLLDKQMILFKTSNPDFYDQYFAARTLNAPSTHTRALFFTVKDTENQPIAKATINMEGLQKAKRTGPSGTCFVDNFPAGMYNGNVEMNGYVAQSFVAAVNNGVTTRIEVALKKV